MGASDRGYQGGGRDSKGSVSGSAPGAGGSTNTGGGGSKTTKSASTKTYKGSKNIFKGANRDVPFNKPFGYKSAITASLLGIGPITSAVNFAAKQNYKGKQKFATKEGLARDFYNKNTTLSAGFSFAHDVLNPVGGVSNPLTPILPSAQSYMEDQGYRLNALGDEETKDTIDLLFGLTQVINRRMLVQLNYSYSSVDGYQNDPYKLVSQVDDSGIVQQNLYESRPDQRTKQSLFAQTKYHFEDSILDFSYRYMWDDWGISSNTFDVRYRVPVSTGYIEPHIRYYQQDAADFYQPFIYDSQALPDYVSADYRVGDLDGITVGLKYGFPLENGDELSFRLEFFQQTPNNPGVELPPELESLPMFEKVQAVVLQVNYSF